MGSAMIRAWLDKKVCKSEDILVYGKHSRKLETRNSKFETRKISNFKYQVSNNSK